MSKFLTGKELEDKIYDIIWDAKETLLIVSPYIKLDNYFKDLFNKHKNNPKIDLLLVFGKNENDVKRSMSKADFDFFKDFLNISIIYVPNLHAKYYANEIQGVITSINLYDYSFKNNIEFGVFYEQSLFSRFSQSADNDAWNESMKIAENNEVVFIKRPVYEHKKRIINLGKNYVHSSVLHDSTEKFYGSTKHIIVENKRLDDFPNELELGANQIERPQRVSPAERPERPTKVKTPPVRVPKSNSKANTEQGYCIRSGKKIKFNPKQPMTKESWLKWNEYKNKDYPEKYCHKTGKPSNGKTSMNNPIL